MARMTLAQTFVAALIGTAGAVSADVPAVATDIAPVHSLVAQVMGDLGEPGLILPPGASPHGHSMRPSEARALSQADFVFWIGEGLTPWLEAPLHNLSGNAQVVELSDLPGIIVHDVRAEAVYPDHDESSDHGHSDGGAGHDDHDDDGADDHDHDHGHGHDGKDMHLWLDPQNAIVWLDLIAETLAAADPDNAVAYGENAASARKSLERQSETIAAALEPVRHISFVVYHDAFQYFERRFGLTSSGAIAQSDATAPSAARVAAIRQAVRDLGVTCLATEPQFGTDLGRAVAEGGAVKMVVLDAVGAELRPGAEFYGALLDNLAQGFRDCL